jgi:tetratricopeptide (TPR) repeat protein
MMWFKIIFDLLTGVASLAQIIQMFQSRASESTSPFEVVPIKELDNIVASPLRTLPPRIHRSLAIKSDARFQIISGGSGVGKTRAALDTIRALAQTTQAETVYVAHRYVDALAPFPQAASVRKVLVFIDDYDFGSIPAASLSFEERKSAYSQSISNLEKLRSDLQSKIDLYGIIVTINSHRMPVSTQDAESFAKDFTFIELPQVSQEEHSEFLGALENTLSIVLDKDARHVLENACDGRFDTIASFLSTFPKGSTIDAIKAEQYLAVLTQVWGLFRDKLSDQQKWVYDQVKLLKDFGLPPRLDYLTHMVHDSSNVVSVGEVDYILRSLWPTYGGQAIIYDGQFGPPHQTSDRAKTAVAICLSIGRRRRRRFRYVYQQELKSLANHLSLLPNQSANLNFFRKCCRWFPRDRYFAYFLANAYAEKKQYIRAISTLYKVLRNPDLLVMFSGKWIEIRLHLLLAYLYQRIGMDKDRNWDSYKKIEREFEAAALLAEISLDDINAESFTPVAPSKPDFDWKQMLKNNLSELGYDPPKDAALLDCKRLQAMVHHSYSGYLLRQTHHEHAALEHEAIVTKILPEFGEAHLNCAKAALQLGDSQRAVKFLEGAAAAQPQYMDEVSYRFMIARDRYYAYVDLGEFELAHENFLTCQKISLQKPMDSNTQLRNDILSIGPDSLWWKQAAQLSRTRVKCFEKTLTYRLLTDAVEVMFPHDWKIDKEGCSLENPDHLCAVFASPLRWDSKTKTPCDASASFVYTTQPDSLQQSAEEFGIDWRKRQEAVFNKNKCTWQSEPLRPNLSNATSCQWQFKIEGPWPKTGMLLVFALPHARILLHLMCETCGQSTFWPLFESISAEFKQQAIFRAGVDPII